MNKKNQNHELLTQKYSTWGDKLLQHTDVLYNIQNKKKFSPITIQLAPTEVCDSDCPFCSVAARPIKNYISFENIKQCLIDFKSLGAKSVEITGGGNPLLYRDKKSNKGINDIIQIANQLGYVIGIITNSENLSKINTENHKFISWIRVSLIKLDEGVAPEDYKFCGFPYKKLGFSYIIYSECSSSPIRKKYYTGTSEKTIEKIAKLVELHKGNIKFVRFAGDCLVRGNNMLVRKRFQDVVEQNDHYKKFFIKMIDDNDVPFEEGCYVGMIRPYVASSPNGNDTLVYICTSHVLENRSYDERFSLCKITDIVNTWNKMNDQFEKTGKPYSITGKNKSCRWADICKHCFYANNNKLLHNVAVELPDKDFA